MNYQQEEHYEYSYSLRISHEMRAFYIPYPVKADRGYPGGVGSWAESDWQLGNTEWSLNWCSRDTRQDDPNRQNNMKDRWKSTTVDKGTQQEEKVLVAVDSGHDVEETLVQWMCSTLCLCLYRRETMTPLAQRMSPKYNTSENDNNVVFNEPLVLSWLTAEQYPKLFLDVILVQSAAHNHRKNYL